MNWERMTGSRGALGDARPTMFAVLAFMLLAVGGGAAIALQAHLVSAIVASLGLLVIISGFLVGANARIEWYLVLVGSLYITLSILWPRYVAVWLPGLPSINPPRIANMLFLVIILISIFGAKSVRDSIFAAAENSKIFFCFIFLYLIARIASIGVSSDLASSLYAVFNEFGVHAVCIIFGVVYGARYGVGGALTFAACVLFVMVVSIALFEAALGHNLFARFVDPANSYVQWAISDKARGGGYRAQGTFGFPITLAEFVVVAFPLAVAGALGIKRSVFLRYALVVAVVLLAGMGVYVSGSRSGYVGLLFVGMFAFFSLMLRGALQGRVEIAHLILAIGLSLLVGVAAYFSVGYVYELSFGALADRVSNSMRALMYEGALRWIVESPLLGFGPGGAIDKVGISTASGQLTVDSHMISLMMDSGLLALSGYVGFFLSSLIICWRKAMVISADEWREYFFLSCAIVGFVPFFFILSLPDNQFLMFFLLGAGVAVKRA